MMEHIKSTSGMISRSNSFCLLGRMLRSAVPPNLPSRGRPLSKALTSLHDITVVTRSPYWSWRSGSCSGVFFTRPLMRGFHCLPLTGTESPRYFSPSSHLAVQFIKPHKGAVAHATAPLLLIRIIAGLRPLVKGLPLILSGRTSFPASRAPASVQMLMGYFPVKQPLQKPQPASGAIR